MKILDFEKIAFRINVFLTGIVFLLLAPTTHIISVYVPEKNERLWMLPLGAVFLSAAVWLVMSLCLPVLIRWGIFEDRRSGVRRETTPGMRRFFKILSPIVVLIAHMILLVGCCYCLIAVMSGGKLDFLFQNLP